MKRGGCPIVECEWLDARSVYEELELAEVSEKLHLCRRYSVGYLIFKDRERLIIAATFDPAEKKLDARFTPDGDSADDFTVIPRQWAQRIITLVPAETETEQEEHKV